MPPQRFERKLAANLGAHAASDNRLTGEDDDATVRTLAGHNERK